MTPIRKAVFPAAGLGTRFLPATKAQPKEMLPIVDKPIIQYGVEEAVAAGIDQIIVVTGRDKRAIVDHFDISFELEHYLKDRGKTRELQVVRKISDMVDITYIHQKEPLGLGHAVLMAKDVVGNEPFALLLPDVLVQGQRSCLTQMLDACRQLPGEPNIIAVEEVPMDRIHMYGVVGVGKPQGQAFEITQMIEKPPRDHAPSNLIITGRYILQPKIFEILADQTRGTGGEIQLTDAMIRLAQEQPFYGLKFEGRSFDCGSKIGFLAANIAYALERNDIAPALRAEIKSLLG